MKKLAFAFTLLALSTKAFSQADHLILEKDDGDSYIFFHDPGQYWYTMGIDRSNSGSFSLNTGPDLNSSQFVMDRNGKIGIGTNQPDAILDVSTTINDQKLGTIFGRLIEGNSSGEGTFLGVRGFGTQNSSYSGKSFAIEHSFYGQTNSSIDFFRGGSTTGGFITFNTSNNTEQLRIKSNGAVGIGTIATGSHKLAVEGTIGAREIKVEASGWSDFVFENDYELRTLEEVEQHINENGHLPEIPNEEEVIENGINLGEMDAKLLQKIEELTLYMIEINKEVKMLKQENTELKEKIEKMESM